MELKDVQNNHNKDKKEVIMTIRTTKQNSKWMKDHVVSPSLLFEKALEELMRKKVS